MSRVRLIAIDDGIGCGWCGVARCPASSGVSACSSSTSSLSNGVIGVNGLKDAILPIVDEGVTDATVLARALVPSLGGWLMLELGLGDMVIDVRGESAYVEGEDVVEGISVVGVGR
jgi:hypothetical protein